MIVSFKHKGLKKFFEKGETRWILQQHISRVNIILAVIHSASEIKDIDRPTFGLHQLKGDRKGEWSVIVRANWRITFKFKNGDAEIVNYEDYH